MESMLFTVEKIAPALVGVTVVTCFITNIEYFQQKQG